MLIYPSLATTTKSEAILLMMKETCSKNIQHNESRSYCIPNKQSQIIKIISKRLLFHLQEALLKNWIMTL